MRNKSDKYKLRDILVKQLSRLFRTCHHKRQKDWDHSRLKKPKGTWQVNVNAWNDVIEIPGKCEYGLLYSNTILMLNSKVWSLYYDDDGNVLVVRRHILLYFILFYLF